MVLVVVVTLWLDRYVTLFPNTTLLGNRMSIAVGYVRVSTSKQADSGLSLEAQRAAIARWCDDAGIVLASIHEDAGVSTPVAERDGLMSALASARELDAAYLVVAKLDRLSRSPFILLTLEQEFSRTGLRITSTEGEGTESDDPASVLVRRMLQAVAEHELQMIRARTRAGLAAKKARGERLGRPPYGFTIEDRRL
jgi:DNA invertase Pin-like site-specific DNA recombinase